MSAKDIWITRGTKAWGAVLLLATAVIAVILWEVRNLPAPGDISAALARHPDLYTLSLGHLGDLTLSSFAYLRLPLVVAGVAVMTGAIAIARCWPRQRLCFFVMAATMILFFHAARLAMIVFDPYLGSKPLADALGNAPPGKLIEADAYYAFSSVSFYTNRQALLWNGRKDNLEYGSYAPGAAQAFIGDADFEALWRSADRYYLLANHEDLPRIHELAGPSAVHVVAESGGKYLLSNRRP